jgi:NADPH:quinone reductase-like Zn-dependent oxidoreductase
VRDLGVTEVVDYADRAVADALPEVDAVFDLVGGDAQADARAALRDGGRIVSIVDPTVREQPGGVYVFVQPNGASLRELARRYDAGEFRVEVAETFPLERAADAHRLIEQGHVRGKLVIEV